MKKLGEHSDKNFVKGFKLWALFDDIVKMEKFDDLHNSSFFDQSEKERIFKIIKIFAFAVMNEHTLIDRMNKEFQNFDEEKIQKIKAKIISSIQKNQKCTSSEDAENLLKSDTAGSEKQLISPPILQNLAGYSMGGLINLATAHFAIQPALLDKMRDFKDERDYIMHNVTSSRHDVDERIESGLELGWDVYISFRASSRSSKVYPKNH